MPVKLHILRTSGDIEAHDLHECLSESGMSLLTKLQEIVGGYIEGVPFFDVVDFGSGFEDCIVYCNETGKLDNLPFNKKATDLWHNTFEQIRPNSIGVLNDQLLGDIAVLTGSRDELDEL